MSPTSAPAIIQARLSSSRLPGKVLRPLGSRTVLEHVVARARRLSDRVVVATSTDPSDDPLVEFLKARHIPWVRGPLENVYGRFRLALSLPELVGAKWFFRVTADCPLLSDSLGSSALLATSSTASVVYFDDFALPRGVAPELVRTSAFLELGEGAMTHDELEHVTLGLYRRHPRRALSLPIPPGFAHPELRLTLDYPEDYALLSALFAEDPEITAERAIQSLLAAPELAALNQHRQTAVPTLATSEICP